MSHGLPWPEFKEGLSQERGQPREGEQEIGAQVGCLGMGCGVGALVESGLEIMAPWRRTSRSTALVPHAHVAGRRRYR